MQRRGTGRRTTRVRSVVAALLFALGAPAAAAVFVVDSVLDETDANVGDGACATATGQCTLRAGVNEANDGPGGDTIILPAGTYTLTIPPGPVGATSFFGDLDVVFNLTIKGAGADSTIIDANHLDRAFLPGALVIMQSRIVNNDADGDGDGLGSGGGIDVNFPTWESPNDPILQKTTVTGNTDGAGVGPDCSGILVDRGGNVLGDTTGCLLRPPS